MRGIAHIPMGIPALCWVAAASQALAAEPVEIPLDLAPLPQVADNWTEAEKTRPLRWQLTTGARSEFIGGPLDGVAVDPGNQGFASIAMDADLNLAPGLNFRGRVVAFAQKSQTRLFVQRAVLEYAPAAQPVRLSFGKDYPAWSFTELAHVLDPSPNEAARIDTDDPLDDYAHPFAGLAVENDAGGLRLLALSEGHKIADLRSAPYLLAARYETQIGKSNLSAQISRRDNRETEFGFGINTTIGAAVVSLEGSVASQSRLPLATVLPGGGVLAGAGRGQTTYQAVVAARLPLSSRWQLEAAYLYNGHGYSTAQWQQFRSAETAVLNSMNAGNFQYANFLSEARSAHADQYLRRNYLTFAISSLENLGNWSLNFGAIHGLDDGGTFGFASASRPVGKAGRLSLSVSGSAGSNNTEFSRRPTEASLKIVWSF